MQRQASFKPFVMTVLLLVLLAPRPLSLAAPPDAHRFAADDGDTRVAPLTSAYPALDAAQSGDAWHSYTNGNDVQDVAVEGNTLWVATTGGVVRWDMSSGNYVKYTTTDGLASNEVNAIAIDAAGHKWFGTYGGGVSEFSTLYEVHLPLLLRNRQP